MVEMEENEMIKFTTLERPEPGDEINAIIRTLSEMQPREAISYHNSRDGKLPAGLKKGAWIAYDKGMCLLCQQRGADGELDYLAVRTSRDPAPVRHSETRVVVPPQENTLQMQVLVALSSGREMSLDDLTSEVGASENAIHMAISNLRKRDYRIVTTRNADGPRGTYRLIWGV